MATIGSSIFTDPMQKSIYDTDQNNIVDEAEIAVPSAHTIVSHDTDTDATGAELDELVSGAATVLHRHDERGGLNDMAAIM